MRFGHKGLSQPFQIARQHARGYCKSTNCTSPLSRMTLPLLPLAAFVMGEPAFELEHHSSGGRARDSQLRTGHCHATNRIGRIPGNRQFRLFRGFGQYLPPEVGRGRIESVV